MERVLCAWEESQKEKKRDISFASKSSVYWAISNGMTLAMHN